MLNVKENNDLAKSEDSCLVVTRTLSDNKITAIYNSTCSKPRRVLCTTRSMLGYQNRLVCYRKPLTLGLPTMISSHMTYELCSTACKTMYGDITLIQMNKCYCLKIPSSRQFDIHKFIVKYETKDCGNPCPGMSNKCI